MKHLFLLALATSMLMASASVVYHDAAPLPRLGSAAPGATEIYTRLPDSLQGRVRDDLWDLGKHSAGIAVRFRTSSSEIHARWHNRIKFNMNHMTPTGIRGLDLYMLGPDSTWSFVNSGRPSLNKATTEAKIAGGFEPGIEREFMLYLPLYDGVDSLYIGIDSAATLLYPVLDLPRAGKPVVMYGSSILQGGCATRPGMAHTNIMMRRLNREVINLGFSGNARLDPEMASFMADIDASIYVVDALPNCTAAVIDERAAEFVRILRSRRPGVPILLVESPIFPLARYDADVAATLADKNRRLRAVYDALSPSDPNLYYFEGERVLDGDTEGTVDNYHFTDGAFAAFAERLILVINAINK